MNPVLREYLAKGVFLGLWSYLALIQPDATTFARIISLVEEAEGAQAPIQRLADRVSAWLIPVVVVFLVIVFVVTRDVRKVVTLMIFTSPAELGLATPMVMSGPVERASG